jgi:hypothetical protein
MIKSLVQCSSRTHISTTSRARRKIGFNPKNNLIPAHGGSTNPWYNRSMDGIFNTSAELELARRLVEAGRDPAEADRLARLILRFLILPSPPDSGSKFPHFGDLQRKLETVTLKGNGEEIEDAFLELYAHVHMNEAPYTSEERRRMDEAGGYWNHAGGLSPVLKAEPWINPDTVSADFGAGNGLQGLLLQLLYPHAKIVQIEISTRMAEIGDGLREWLGVAADRVEWINDDVLNVSATGYDFIYLYRPVRPEDTGRDFYTRFAREVEAEDSPPVIFSVADCLKDFLSDRYEVFYGDGHLTCFRPS